MEAFTAGALPVIVAALLTFGWLRGTPVFDAFLAGAKEGVSSSLRLLPTLAGLLMAVAMVRASGLLELLCGLLRPVTDRLHIAPELLPLMLLRPVSGSGSSAYTLSLFESVGPDSETGRIASVLAASTETTFYAVAVYFGACGYKKLRYTVPAALLGDITAVVFSVLTVKWFAR